jgi:cytochrome P450
VSSHPGETQVSGGVPGPTGSEAQELFQALRSDALPTYLQIFDRYGDVARLQMGPFITHFMFHPDHVKHVLVTAHATYDKETYGNRRLRSYAGQGLLFSDGDTWQRQRRLTMPSLATNQHGMFAQLTREVFLAQLQLHRNTSGAEEIADIQEWVARPMFMAMVQGLISRSLSTEEATALREALCTVIEQSQQATVPKVRLDAAAPMDDFSRALTLLDDTILDSIRRRKGEPARPDFLGRLIGHADAEGNPFTEHELLDQVKTMLFAGHDTGAHGLAFAMHLLSQRPELQARVREEGSWLAGQEALTDVAARMRWTEAVVLEAFRLLPPVWAIERRARENDVIAGCSIPKGSVVLLSPYVTHRHPQFWDEPQAFQPERFLRSDVPRHRYAFFPFGGGPRICVGNNLAVLQLKIALGTILSRAALVPSPALRLDLQQLVIMRFRHGLPLGLVPLP